MMNDPERFKHDRSAYERPDLPYRCGKETFWGKPCSQGPQPGGICGGTTECTPFKNKQGRFECKRPRGAGGPCQDGPLPDGTCSLKHPPCTPRLSLRSQRKRLVLITSGLLIGCLGGLLGLTHGHLSLAPLDPGPLSAKHAHFTADNGCASCHSSHAASPKTWLKAALSKTELNTQCMTCHTFGGPTLSPHNSTFPHRQDLKDLSCVTCHTEHRGATFKIDTMTDAQCNACHQVKFKSFSEGHPSFSKKFPHSEKTSIQFDHQTHLNRYFKDPKLASSAPQSCVSCHALTDPSQKHMNTLGFDHNCASCHARDISGKDLLVFRFPQITKNSIDPEAVQDVCGPTMEQWEAAKNPPAPAASDPTATPPAETAPETFEGISFEEPDPLSVFLLGIDPADPDGYSPTVQKFILDLAQNGNAPLAQLLDAKAGKPVGAKLLAGLNPEVIKRAACAWALNQEYTLPSDLPSSGWYADMLELKYKPQGHGDPVAREWIEFGISAALNSGANEKPKAAVLRDGLLSKNKGPGSCLQCHSVTLNGTASPDDLKAEWHFKEPRKAPFTSFSHGPHVGLLGGKESCVSCHALDPNAPYAASFNSPDPADFSSNFKNIRKETCMTCHGSVTNKREKASAARQDCLLCHTYHLRPGLSSDMAQKVKLRTNGGQT